jgi:hypothetical protein
VEMTNRKILGLAFVVAGLTLIVYLKSPSEPAQTPPLSFDPAKDDDRGWMYVIGEPTFDEATNTYRVMASQIPPEGDPKGYHGGQTVFYSGPPFEPAKKGQKIYVRLLHNVSSGTGFNYTRQAVSKKWVEDNNK